MKSIRIISVFLIFVLGSSPALAAICATSCASNTIISSLNSAEMAGMANCHEKEAKETQHKPTNEHKSCAMGNGCHFTQATLASITTKYVFLDITKQSFPRFSPSEKSVDLSPPLKPPA